MPLVLGPCVTHPGLHKEHYTLHTLMSKRATELSITHTLYLQTSYKIVGEKNKNLCIASVENQSQETDKQCNRLNLQGICFHLEHEEKVSESKWHLSHSMSKPSGRRDRAFQQSAVHLGILTQEQSVSSSVIWKSLSCPSAFLYPFLWHSLLLILLLLLSHHWKLLPGSGLFMILISFCLP